MYPIAEQFCEDLIREILVKLPVKTLIRFKKVSKTWFYIITSQKFVKRHYYYSVEKSQSPGNKNPKSFFLLRIGGGLYPDRLITSISLTHDQQECTFHENIFSPYIEMIDSWNVYSPPLFSVGLGLYIVKFRSPTVVLWNPATRLIVVLPPSPFDESGKTYCDFSFGQAEFKGDMLFYKVVLITYRREDRPDFKLELYDSRSNSWKVLSCNIGYDRSWHPALGINFKKTLHLLSVPAHLNAYIITFDYSCEVFGRMELPALPQITEGCYELKSSFLTLHDYRFLCLVVFWRTVQEAVDTFFDVWVMRQYGVRESWVKKGTIGPVKDNLIMLNYWKSTGGVFSKLHDDRGRIYMHSCASSGVINIPVTCASSAVINLPVTSNKFENTFVFEHMESIVSINGAWDESTRTQKPC